MGGFCEKLLPSDRWQWSDVSGLQHRPLDGVALPSPHWEWESDWYVDENFGGEPTEKGVGELGTHHGCPWGRGWLVPACPCSALAPVVSDPCLLWVVLLQVLLSHSGNPAPSSSATLPGSWVTSPEPYSAPPWHFRGGRMPWTFPPPTRETRSGIRACGGGSGSGTGDTSPGTPGPRSSCLGMVWACVLGTETPGRRVKEASSPNPCLCARGHRAHPGACLGAVPVPEPSAPYIPSSGRWPPREPRPG